MQFARLLWQPRLPGAACSRAARQPRCLLARHAGCWPTPSLTGCKFFCSDRCCILACLLQVKALKEGKAVQKPIYNHVTGAPRFPSCG